MGGGHRPTTSQCEVPGRVSGTMLRIFSTGTERSPRVASAPRCVSRSCSLPTEWPSQQMRGRGPGNRGLWDGALGFPVGRIPRGFTHEEGPGLSLRLAAMTRQSSPMNRTRPRSLARPQRERVAVGRVRDLAGGSWSQCVSKFWKTRLSMNGVAPRRARRTRRNTNPPAFVIFVTFVVDPRVVHGPNACPNFGKPGSP